MKLYMNKIRTRNLKLQQTLNGNHSGPIGKEIRDPIKFSSNKSYPKNIFQVSPSLIFRHLKFKFSVPGYSRILTCVRKECSRPNEKWFKLRCIFCDAVNSSISGHSRGKKKVSANWKCPLIRSVR